jgi:ABC-2 type transport system ATP-binding protein
MSTLVETDRLYKSFGAIKAVNGISLAVARGEVLGFLGPNGAGKSTTMKMITGFLTPDSGTATVAGIDVGRSPKDAKRKLGYLPEGAPLYGDMSIRAFLGFIAEVRGFTGIDRSARIAKAVERTDLGPVLDQTIETLSKGYKRRVGIAQAILHDPPVLVLDEPTDGLDPNQKHHVRDLIKTMAHDKAIIVSTHILEEVEAVCSRAVIIDKGRVVADGTAEELLRRLPQHNAVAIRLAPAAVEAAKNAVAGLAGVAGVDLPTGESGPGRMRVRAAAGASIAAAVTGALREKGIAVEEVFIERGRLDDVFRQITSSDHTGETARHV